MWLSQNEARRLEGLTPLQFHERYHARLLDYTYDECRGWPCRMRTVRGWLRERRTRVLVLTRLVHVRDWWWDRGGEEGR